ncbi:MAG: hypothetical protein WCH11_00960 [Bdellovibrio sp.]
MRDAHFQEIDSDLVYYSMSNFEVFSQKYTNFSYAPEHGWHRQWRLYLIEKVIDLRIPEFFKLPFYLPYTSTYSPGPSFVYGLIYSLWPQYQAFLSASMAFQIILFHLSGFLLFLVFRKLEFPDGSAVAVSALYIFAMGPWEYSYNLGSPFWMSLSSLAWLSVFVFSRTERLARNISISSGVLIFFSYLIIIYWLAFLVFRFASASGDLLAKFKSVLKHQWIGFFFIGICTLFFFQPGQGIRLSIYSFDELFEEILSIFLNFSAVSMDGMRFQSLYLGALWSIGFLCLVSKLRKKEIASDLARILFSVGFVYLIFYFSLLLGFAATRHIFFLMPVFYLTLGFGFKFVFDRVKLADLSFTIALLVFAPQGLSSRYQRTQDLLLTVDISRDEKVILVDSRFALPQVSDQVIPTIPALGIGISSVDQIRGSAFVYLSQWVPIESWLDEFFRNELNQNFLLAGGVVKISNQIEKCESPPIKFLPIETYGNSFQKPNCLYFARFRLD